MVSGNVKLIISSEYMSVRELNVLKYIDISSPHARVSSLGFLISQSMSVHCLTDLTASKPKGR